MEENQEELLDLGLNEIPGNESEILGIEDFNQAEWLFQFDDDEPITIAWSNTTDEAGELNFILKPNSGSSVTFQSNDGKKTLRLFSRRLTDERRDELENPLFQLRG
jgi:hypothetical protein